MKKHDHRSSLWIIAGGYILWCYQCGAWRMNSGNREKWHRPTGIGGENPAMREVVPTRTKRQVVRKGTKARGK